MASACMPEEFFEAVHLPPDSPPARTAAGESEAGHGARRLRG